MTFPPSLTLVCSWLHSGLFWFATMRRGRELLLIWSFEYLCYCSSWWCWRWMSFVIWWSFICSGPSCYLLGIGWDLYAFLILNKVFTLQQFLVFRLLFGIFYLRFLIFCKSLWMNQIMSLFESSLLYRHRLLHLVVTLHLF